MIIVDWKKPTIFLVFILIFILMSFTSVNYDSPKSEVFLTVLVTLVGLVSIILVFNVDEVHKKAFIIILMFGLITAFISPIFVAHDEVEHFARSDITSKGILFPEYIQNQGYVTSDYFNGMAGNVGGTFVNTNFLNDKITDGEMIFPSAFSQNLFYVYVAQALGILLAQFMNLSVIFTLWFARLFNLLLYAIIVCFAIKKAPTYKMHLLIVSVMPLAIFQASSVNCDAFIFAFAILNIAYFIRMYKSQTIDNVDVGIYLVSGLLIGLIKFPYSILLMLMFLIPSDKFKLGKLPKILVLLVIGVCMMVSIGYGSKQLLMGSRLNYFIENNVNSTNQASYMMKNPLEFGWLLLSTLFTSGYVVFIQDLSFYHQILANGYMIYNALYLVFFVVFILTQNTIKLSRIKKFYVGLVFLVIYASIFIIQYLSWTPVAHNQILGVSARYFVPILPLLLLIFGNDIFKRDIDEYLVLFAIIFLGGMLILTISRFY